jgi:hypothetical protein
MAAVLFDKFEYELSAFLQLNILDISAEGVLLFPHLVDIKTNEVLYDFPMYRLKPGDTLNLSDAKITVIGNIKGM